MAVRVEFIAMHAAELFDALSGKLWHATCHSKVESILAQGIDPKAEPEWLGGVCRKLGGVALMDFRALSGSNLQKSYARGCWWSGWLGGAYGGRRCGVWLQIDGERLAHDALLDSAAISRLRRMDEALAKSHFIPEVEACHVGTIPPEAIAAALLIYKRDPSTWQLVERTQELSTAIKAFLPSCADEYRSEIRVGSAVGERANIFISY
jgi:hypothetical protein